MKQRYSFIDNEMRMLRRNEVNLHHCMWTRNEYLERPEKIYRSLSGLILPMVISSHNELHANVRPPIKPRLDLMNEAIDFNRRMLDPSESPYHNFNQMISFFRDVAEGSPDAYKAEQAWKIAGNLTTQEKFITQGRVLPL